MKHYIISLLLFALVFISACSEHVGSIQPDMRTQNDHIEEFWQWFSKKKKQYEAMPDSGYTERLDIIIGHLAPIADGLAVEVSKESHGTQELIISADGARNKFPIVEAIVKAAPVIPGWKAVAFRQKASEDFVLVYQNLRLSPAEMSFHPIIEGDSLDLIIYANSIKNKNRNEVIKYGLITMDNVLGEYTATIKVRSYDFQDIQDVSRGERVCKLKELPAFVDRFYASKYPISKKK
jgi:hypothetical protein